MSSSEPLFVSTYVAELHQAQLAQCRDNLAADFVGDVQLGELHLPRAEERWLIGRHLGATSPSVSGERSWSDGGGIDGVGLCVKRQRCLR